MSDYLTEEEQVQQLKNWVKQYGPTVLLGILLALLIGGGWHYWQNYRNKILTHASTLYDEMLTLRAQNNNNEASLKANKLLTRYPKTPYADMAALMLAREAVLKKNYPEAIVKLNWIIEHTDQSAMKEIARLRMARILITDKKPDAALILLRNVKDKNFSGFADEIRGDAYAALSKRESARHAYQIALAELPNAEVTRPILQMKYDNLASEKTTL